MTDQTPSPQSVVPVGPKRVLVLKSAVERLILAADMYGVAHLDSDDMDDDAVELQDATEGMKDALAAAPAPSSLAGGEVCDLSDAIDQFISDAIANGAVEIDGDDTIQWCKPALEQTLVAALAGCGYRITASHQPVLTGISLDGQQGDPAGMMTVKAHFSDGTESVLIEDNHNAISHWKSLAVPSPEAPAREGEPTLRVVPDTTVEGCYRLEGALTHRHEAPAEGAGEDNLWLCNNCKTEFISPMKERVDNGFDDHGTGPSCPTCKAFGQFTYRVSSHLGDPCIHCGSPHDEVAVGPCPMSLRARSSAPEAREGEAVAWRKQVWVADGIGTGWLLSNEKPEPNHQPTEIEPLYTHPAPLSADHAELTLLAEAAGGEAWSLNDWRPEGEILVCGGDGSEYGLFATVNDDLPEVAAFIAAANPATVLALLSEIAALRGDLTETRVAADLLVSSVRADLRQAERQRDEEIAVHTRIAAEVIEARRQRDEAVGHLKAMSHVAPRSFEVKAALAFLASQGADQ